MRLRRIVSIGAAVAAFWAPNVTSAVAFSGPEIVDLLSAQREANGIPGALVERPDWSAACAQHNHYEAQVGELTHFEDPGSVFYTDEGAWAGRNSVLASGYYWSDGNPWENAPLHLLQMLGPALAELGAAESEGYNCATTWPGYTRPEPTELVSYSYPGDGVGGVVPSELAAESPFVPGDFAGLPKGTTTGRHLLAFLSGYVNLKRDEEAEEVQAGAILTGPSGPVELRVVDSSMPEIGGFMPAPSAFLIPVLPLQPNSTYATTVNWSVGGETIEQQSFSFTTGTDPGGSEAVSVGKLVHRRSCGWYARKARAKRNLSRRLRRRAQRLAKSASAPAERRRARRLKRKAQRARRRAHHLERRARRCRQRLRAGAKSR